jgi:glutathione-specific gamma-glutamylcyclotransferase
MWIFAYGSLIFRPSFAHLETRRAFVRGWARRLWQGSPDHRGVPEAPGLVATLVRAPGETCGGLAYRIDAAAKDAILAELDIREQAGFVRATVSVADAATPGAPAFADALTYVAAPENAHFMGPLDEPAIAALVASRRGPSGPNREYVERLHRALRELAISDVHIDAVARDLAAHP